VKLPDSLYARSALAFLSGVVALECSLMFIGWMLVVAPLVQRSADDFATLILRAAQVQAGLHGRERQEFLAHLREVNGLTIESPSSSLAGTRSRLPYIHYLESALTRQSGRNIAITARESDYALDLPVSCGALRFVFPQRRIGTAPLLTLTAMALLALAVSLAAAILLARRITRPFEILLRRTEQIGRGQAPDPIPETGPKELRQLAARFNVLGNDVRELLDDRTIMLAGLSHDLRSPISRMRMALTLAHTGMEPELHRQMQKAVEELESMTGQYLDFSAGLRRDAAFSAPADAIVADVLAQAPQERISAALHSSATVPETAFRRCVQNLLHNALKYGGNGPVEIALHDGPSELVLEISDRGPGIPADELNRVFRPFVRLDRSRGTPGSGLGLSVVQQICRTWGWRTELLRRDGGGTCARLTICR